ncbi:MAG: hypothetical protein M3Z08_15070 [Chloroflexota bacterium]|nr:hypothetical protein [Chloroflexota bacterium]
MIERPSTLPPHLYPAFAPLPLPLAEHLVLQEYRRSRRVVLAKRPHPEQVWASVLERVSKARRIAYEYMHPFVIVDTKRSKQGLVRTFPAGDWLLDTLATYTPEGKRNAGPTLDYWQKKGLLRRDKPRGLLDLNSVAALLVARIAEEEHQRNWLPSELPADEPAWWCYSQADPTAPIQPVPLSLSPTLAPTAVLWTPWPGAAWLSEEWQIIENQAFRWAGAVSTEHELAIWDRDLARTILAAQTHILTAQETVQAALMQEARHLILQRVARQRRAGSPWNNWPPLPAREEKKELRYRNDSS